MVKWGILGLGRAANSFAEAIKEVENAELVSIASLSKSKLKFFGNKYDKDIIIDLILIYD